MILSATSQKGLTGLRNTRFSLRGLGGVRTNPNPPGQVYYWMPSGTPYSNSLPGATQGMSWDQYWSMTIANLPNNYSNNLDIITNALRNYWVSGQGVAYYKDYQGNPVLYNPTDPMGYWYVSQMYIPGMQQLQVGTDISGARSNQWQYAQYATGKNACANMSPDLAWYGCDQHLTSDVDYSAPFRYDSGSDQYFVGDVPVPLMTPQGFTVSTGAQLAAAQRSQQMGVPATQQSIVASTPVAPAAQPSTGSAAVTFPTGPVPSTALLNVTAPPPPMTVPQAQGYQGPVGVPTVPTVPMLSTPAAPMIMSTDPAIAQPSPVMVSATTPVSPVSNVAPGAQLQPFVSPSPTATGATAPASSSGFDVSGITDWIQANPLMAAVIALGALFVFKK